MNHWMKRKPIGVLLAILFALAFLSFHQLSNNSPTDIHLDWTGSSPLLLKRQLPDLETAKTRAADAYDRVSSAGMDVWISFAGSMKNTYLGLPSSAVGLDAQMVVKTKTNLIVAVAFLVIVAVASIPVAIVVGQCCIGRPRDFYTPFSKKTYASTLTLILCCVSVVVTLITGIRSSASMYTALTNLNGTVNTLTTDARSTVTSLPQVLNAVVQNVSAGLNTTVDNVVRQVNVTELQMRLGDGTVNGPGTVLMTSLKTLADSVEAIKVAGAQINPQILRMVGSVNALRTNITAFTAQVNQLNGNFNATTKAGVRYNLRRPVPNFDPTIDSLLQQLAANLTEATSGTWNNSLTALYTLPNLTLTYYQNLPLLYNISSTFYRAADPPLLSIKSNLASEVTKTGNQVLNQTSDIRQKALDVIDQLSSTVSPYFEKGGPVEKYYAIAAAVVPALLTTSTISMGLVVLFIVIRKPVGLQILLAPIVLLTLALILLGAGLLVTSIALSDGCNVATDPDSKFLTTVSEDLGAKTRSFFAARDTCLAPASRMSLLDVGTYFGLNASLVNFTAQAIPAVESFNIQNLTSFNTSTIFPASTALAIGTTVNNSLTQLASAVFPDFGAFAPSALLVLTTLSNISTSLNSMSNLRSTNTVGFLNLFAPTPAAKTLSLADVSAFSSSLNSTDAAADALNRDAASLAGSFATLQGLVNNVMGAIGRIQVAAPQLLEGYNNCSNIVTTFVGQAQTQLVGYVPTAKQQLYTVTNNAEMIVDTSLPCQPLMYSSVALQNSVCRSFSATLDAMWLSFIVCGFSLFVCLCFMGCYANRLASRPRKTMERGRQSSMGSEHSLAGPEAKIEGGKKEKKAFGKATPKIVSSRAMDQDEKTLGDKDGLNPEWRN
ncbi:hypothetical protein HDV05_001613 [Chytridiales sp. JEL 0842]|nr:hypothetical protein HDV05_001613 [Chytridiales sp. JEL 0842]